MKDNHYIGIFDSGVGGFSVLKEVKKKTNADIFYYGDSLNAPYGNRSKEEIVALIKNIILHLKKNDVSHFVSACNSMSVHTTEEMLKELDIADDKYLDMVTAIYKYLTVPALSNVLIVGTKATISSGVYQEIVLDKSEKIDIFIPNDLAFAIEENNKEIIKRNVEDVLNYAKEINATHILYACTHYPLVHNDFENRAKEIKWTGEFIDPSIYVAKAVKDWNLNGERNIKFESSKVTPVFEKHIEFTLINS